MKTIRTIFTIAVFAAATMIAAAQDYPDEYLGLPGDNLNLYAVMNLFQQSETLEGFEQSLNNEESRINNLDLNGDNLIDYITVSDYVEGNVHTIILRATLDRNEQQDVAVFVVEKLRNGEVQIQLIGDEALYGPDYIVEPIYAETPNPGYTGRTYRRNVNVVYSTYYDIAAWPVIRFIYHPRYVVWRSHWYWGYYPVYWHPWRPYYWHYYYGYHYHWHNYYYSHYRHWNHYRCRNYYTYYRPHMRVYSPRVIVNINKGHYRNTYSRPDQRRAGEELYARTAASRNYRNQTAATNPRTVSKSGALSTRQGVQRTATPTGTTRSAVSTNGRNPNAVKSTSTQRNTYSRSTTTRTSNQNNGSTVRSVTPRSSSQYRGTTVQRSTTRQNNAVAQRGNQGGSSRTSVQRSSSRSTSPAVQARSQQSRSNATVSRNSSRSNSPAVQRSSSKSYSRPSAVQRSASQGRSNSSVSRNYTRSAPSVQQRNSSSRSSAVQRSQPSKSRTTPSVSRSSSKRSSPSIQRSSSSRSSAQRSSSKSRTSSGSHRSSSARR